MEAHHSLTYYLGGIPGAAILGFFAGRLLYWSMARFLRWKENREWNDRDRRNHSQG
jgi:hypothetical protein